MSRSPLILSPRTDSFLDALSDPFSAGNYGDSRGNKFLTYSPILGHEAMVSLFPPGPPSQFLPSTPPPQSLSDTNDILLSQDGEDRHRYYPPFDASSYSLPPVPHPFEPAEVDRKPSHDLFSIREKDVSANAQDALRMRMAVSLLAVGDLEAPIKGPLVGGNEPLINFSPLPRTPRHGPSRSQRRRTPPTPYALPKFVSPPPTPSPSPYFLSVASTPSASPAASTPAALPSDDEQDSSDNEYLPQQSERRKKQPQQQRRPSPQKTRTVRRTAAVETPTESAPNDKKQKKNSKPTNLQIVLEDLPYTSEDIKKDTAGYYHCPFPKCPHKASSEGDLGRHLESSAHATHKYYCLACLKDFAREDSMKRHWRGDESKNKHHQATHDRRVKRGIPCRVRKAEFDWLREQVQRDQQGL